MEQTLQKRTRRRNDKSVDPSGPVLYWMQRDQRVRDNWALHYAQKQAQARQVPLLVVFNLVPQFGDATYRHYDFMIRGLQEVSERLGELHIPFAILTGEPVDTLPTFIKKLLVGVEAYRTLNRLQKRYISFGITHRHRTLKRDLITMSINDTFNNSCLISYQ